MNSLTPRQVSRRWIAPLARAGEMSSNLAAAEKLPTSVVVRKICRSSTRGIFFKGAKSVTEEERFQRKGNAEHWTATEDDSARRPWASIEIARQKIWPQVPTLLVRGKRQTGTAAKWCLNRSRRG